MCSALQETKLQLTGLMNFQIGPEEDAILQKDKKAQEIKRFENE